MASPAPPTPLRVRDIIAAVAARLVGGPLTDGVRAFISNVAYLLSADIVATALTFGLSAWVVRLMGPAEFGLANLVMSTAQLVLIPMLMGLHAATARTIAATPESGRHLGAALALVGLLVPLVTIVGVALSGPLAQLTGVPRHVLLWSLPLAATLSAQQLLQGMLSGLHRFRAIALYNVWSAVVYAVLILVVLARGLAWPFWLFVAVTGGRAVTHALLCLLDLRSQIKRPSWRAVRTLAGFGGLYTLGSVAYLFALGAIDSLMLNAWHGAAVVGLYGAYYATFNIVASRVTKLVSDVLIPTAAAQSDTARMVARLGRLLLGPGWLVVPLAMILSRMLFLVYGDAYAFSWATAAWLGACIYLHVGVTLSADLMVARGVADLRIATAISAVTAVLNVAGNFLLIPSLDVAGSLIATATSSGVGLALRIIYLLRARDRRTASV